MKKKFLSIILSLAIVMSLTIPALAVEGITYSDETGMTVTESLTTKTVSTSVDEKTFVSSHDKIRNITTIQLISDGVVINEAVIDHDALVAEAMCEEESSVPMTMADESAGSYKVQGENTFTNFEYEQWKYPNYNNGNGYFWFLRHPSDDQRSVYDLNNSSEYHEDLMTFKDAVETINTTEVSVGFSVALGVGSIVTIGLAGTALLAALDAYLESNDVPGGVSNVIAWKEAIEEAQACWLRLFY